MGASSALQWSVLSLVALLALVGLGLIRDRSRPGRRFLEGMNPTTSLALAGAMLLALALLVDVYGPDWGLGALGEDLSLGFAGSGGVLVLLSFFVDRRSNRRS